LRSKCPRCGINSTNGNSRLKKTLHASEQERADVQAARREWQASQPTVDITTLVFLDETGASTNMARRYGRAPRGERCVASVPHGHWHTTTFVAGLRHDDITAPMVADGAMTGALFLKYVQEFLCPTLHPGDIVIADNLRSHKVAGVKAAVEAVGAHIRSLPPYSPDLNPIENCLRNSKRCCAKPPRVPWTRSGMKSGGCLTASHQTNARATSHPQAM
jgi:transposase